MLLSCGDSVQPAAEADQRPSGSQSRRSVAQKGLVALSESRFIPNA
jgi:hypothetical protein